MRHVYGLSESAQENVSTASRIATEVALANAPDVDVHGRFPTEA